MGYSLEKLYRFTRGEHSVYPSELQIVTSINESDVYIPTFKVEYQHLQVFNSICILIVSSVRGRIKVSMREKT